MSTEANKALARRFYESYNDKDLDTSFELIAPNLINHAFGGQFTRESWREVDKTLFPALPDFALQVDDQIADGDKVITRWMMTGTHQGAFLGIAPTGKKVALTGITIDRVADGKIVEHWSETNIGQVIQQLSDPVTDRNSLQHLADEYFRLVNAHDLDGLVALHDPEYVSHEANAVLSTLADYRKFIAEFFQAFPDAQIRPIHVIVEGDMLVLNFTTTGTNTAPFMGLPATGKKVNFSEIRIRRVANGKIMEHWGLLDSTTFFAQLQ